MNTLIRIRGWVTDSAVIDPESKIEYPEQIHRLRIQPENPGTFDELEQAIEELKRESETPRESLHSHQDDVIEGSEVILKSLHMPKLVDGFDGIERDEELLGKFVQAVGHLQIFKDGNVFLSVHIIEPAYTDDFDPID